MNIRAATVDDAEAIADLERSLFGADAWSLAQVADELGGPGRIARVAEEGELLGYVVLHAGPDVVDLHRIGVLPTRQRQGVATRLLGREGRRMMLEVSAVNAAAIAFYLHEGFVEIDRRRAYYRDGSDAVVMEREALR